LQQQSDLDSAIAAFREALKHAPNAPEIHNTLGTALRQKGDVEAARREFQEGARLNKRKSDLQAALFAFNTGVARLREGKLDEAIERFEAAIKLNPEDAMAHYNLAKAFQQKGRREAARAAYERAKQINPRLKPLK
jgi:superkiller protein 3